MTHGQCDARLTVTFPAAGHHRPLTSSKLYCLQTETHVWTTCPRLLPESGTAGSRTRDLLCCEPTPWPLHHRATFNILRSTLTKTRLQLTGSQTARGCITAVQWWIHTHTHPFKSLLSGTTRVSRYQKGKTNLDFTEARVAVASAGPYASLQLAPDR